MDRIPIQMQISDSLFKCFSLTTVFITARNVEIIVVSMPACENVFETHIIGVQFLVG